ncbi:MAG TPA: 50S ribosomal protein L17 [Candidatus Polarisedimenticolia bacterium]|nr:50S ribosomal protein L17 [Candidatus Polarisedimenticolia bacterium]
MRHGKALRKLGRDSEHRIALLRNLSISLFDKERITTTLHKAKELRPFAEKLITLARRDTLHSRRLAGRDLHDKKVLKKLFDTLGPRFAERPGGYSRILKLGWRQGDGAEVAILELLGSEPVFDKGAKKGKKGRKAKKQAAEAAEAAKAGEEGKEEHDHDHDHKEHAKQAAPKAKKKTPGSHPKKSPIVATRGKGKKKSEK